MNSCTYNLRSANPFYQAVVDRITDRLQMNRIEVYEADTDNACATLYKNSGSDTGKPIITYNPEFIRHIHNYSVWAMYSVFAHEVAHHYNHDLYGAFLNQFYGTDMKSHRQELNADYIAGWMLSCEGASLKDAMDLYNAMEMPETPSHPAKSKRIQAMKEGWSDANCRINPTPRIENHIQTQSSGLAETLIGIGALILFGAGIAALAGGGK